MEQSFTGETQLFSGGLGISSLALFAWAALSAIAARQLILQK
jgi:hypothetical protein